MNAKKVLTFILLAFVVASIVFLLLKDRTFDNVALEQDPETSVIVYYFHGNERCATCKTIEAYAQEAIQGSFKKEIEQGQLVFKSVNLDIPGNEHFIQDYQLTVKTIIVARFKDGNQVEWKNLERVWELVPDKPAYFEYIQSGTRELLDQV